MDWDAVSGLVGFLLWTLFLVAKRLKQQRARASESAPDTGRRPKRRPRSADPVEIPRDYEPIEPR